MRWAAVFALRAYKRLISPLLPPACRFYPTCSEYAAQAIAKHGLARGGTMAAKRLMKCNPLHPGGVDPVPER
ncbi:MAG TPA: membrane protein insertion efficiency factor YidD [Candidatus Baltobacteraceae bacterium]|nr:membrane protein insertion efficiency factor YidD [Candidatus Baltobacteraceae bacterium]